MLRRQHARNDTLVIDELGLQHGKCRADIAVINGYLVGYEIKSDYDSLRRLEGQVQSYNAIFDRVFVVVGGRHIDSLRERIPEWWGVIASSRGPRGAINFRMKRRARVNRSVDPVSVARLLWRDEAADILEQRGLPPRILRQPRTALYKQLTELLSTCELREAVRHYLQKRRNWRCPGSLSRCGDSCQPSPTL
ncbi:MAG: sce7726 family protein [Planctomycetota bacterium]